MLILILNLWMVIHTTVNEVFYSNFIDVIGDGLWHNLCVIKFCDMREWTITTENPPVRVPSHMETLTLF